MRFITRFRFLTVLSALAVALSFSSSAHAVRWEDNFDDGDAEDGIPETWTYNEIGFTPGIYDASSGDYSLSNPGGGDDDNLVPSVDVSFTDTYVRTQAVIVPAPNDPDFLEAGGNVGVMARWDPFTFSGYFFILDDGEQWALGRIDGGAIAELGGADDIGIDAKTDVVVELEFVGDQINGYLYRPDEPRPDTPIVSVTDSTYASGRAGIVYNEDDEPGLDTAGLFRWAEAQDTPLSPLAPEFEADFDEDGDVDGDDFLLWQVGFGAGITSGATKMDGDWDNDGDVDGDDFLGWQAEFPSPGSGAGSGAVPEPASCVLLALFAMSAAALRRKRG